MDPLSSRCNKKDGNRGAWTAEEDQKLAQVIEIHGPKRWKKVAAKAGKHDINPPTRRFLFFFLLKLIWS